MIKNYIENSFTTVGQNFFKDYQIFLKVVETEESNNLIFESKKYSKTLQFDYTKEMSNINHKVYDNSFFDLVIRLSDKKTVYKRSYEKLSTALIKAGGIMSGIYYTIKISLWFPVKTVYEINAINKVFKFDMTKNIKKRSGKYILKVNSNFNSDNRIIKSKINENNLNILKIKNDEDIKDNNKNISNQEFLYFNKNPDLNLKLPNLKDIQSDSSINKMYNKNIFNDNFLMKNNINQKKLSKKNLFNNLEGNMEKEIKNNIKNINKVVKGRYIVDTIKIKWYQFLCYYPLRHCSNNFKLNLAENGRKFYTKNLDIINVYKNVMMNKKLYNYMVINKSKFGLSDNNSISFYDKPIISDNISDYS